jgi:hypothetical protein
LGGGDLEAYISRPAREKEFTRSYLNRKKLGVVASASHPSYGWKHKIGQSRSRPTQAKSETLSPK